MFFKREHERSAMEEPPQTEEMVGQFALPALDIFFPK